MAGRRARGRRRRTQDKGLYAKRELRTDSVSHIPSRSPTAVYQLKRSIRFISGSPPKDAVVWSPVIFPKSCGFLKSTWLLGALKPQLWNGFWKSKRSCRFQRSLKGKFFFADTWEYTSPAPVTMLRPPVPLVKSGGGAKQFTGSTGFSSA